VAEDTQGEGDRSRTPHGEPIDPDAHGQAAILLVEALIHTLVEAHVLTTAQALTAVRTASEVKLEAPDRTNESKHRMCASLALLSAIEASMASDRPFAANDDAAEGKNAKR